MPRGDGSGPMGMGPRTGRAAGYCAGYTVPGFMNPTLGRGLGMARGRGGGGGLGTARGRGGGGGLGMAWRRGRGGGWGRGSGLGLEGGWGFSPAPLGAPYAAAEPAAEQQLASLREQAAWLEQQMSAVNERIQALDESKD